MQGMHCTAYLAGLRLTLLSPADCSLLERQARVPNLWYAASYMFAVRYAYPSEDGLEQGNVTLRLDEGRAGFTNWTTITSPGDTATVVIDGVSAAVDLSAYGYDQGCYNSGGKCGPTGWPIYTRIDVDATQWQQH